MSAIYESYFQLFNTPKPNSRTGQAQTTSLRRLTSTQDEANAPLSRHKTSDKCPDNGQLQTWKRPYEGLVRHSARGRRYRERLQTISSTLNYPGFGYAL